MDIEIAWNPALGQGDWVIAGGSVAVGRTGSDDLETAVLVSLFTDRVAPEGWVGPDGDTDPRGCWIDSYEDEPIGSWLWMLFRAKKFDRTTIPLQAQRMCQDALAWMITDGVAQAVTASAMWLAPDRLGIRVVITKPSGEAFPFAWTWKGF